MPKKFDWVGAFIIVFFGGLLTCSTALFGYVMWDIYTEKLKTDAAYLKLEQHWQENRARMTHDLEEIEAEIEAVRKLQEQRKGHDATRED